MKSEVRISAALVIGFFVLLAAIGIMDASAHHKEGHQGGPPTSSADDNDDNKHPSGKDRETNDGPEDDTQGKSPSDPDDDGRGPDRSNGGPDKPGGSGGVDRDDQDGNNGCGNDDDFEDDNEGLCGGKKRKAKPTPTPRPSISEQPSPTPSTSGTPMVTPSDTPTRIADDEKKSPGVTTSTPCNRVDDGLQQSCNDGEDGESKQKDTGTTLPFTGAQILGFIFAATALIVGGFYFWRRGN